MEATVGVVRGQVIAADGTEAGDANRVRNHSEDQPKSNDESVSIPRTLAPHGTELERLDRGASLLSGLLGSSRLGLVSLFVSAVFLIAAY